MGILYEEEFASLNRMVNTKQKSNTCNFEELKNLLYLNNNIKGK